MDSQKLKDLVVDALEDRKAQDIQALDVRELTDITDYMIIATGRSGRQVKAMAENVIQQCKALGQSPLGAEGMNHPEWVLIDLCDVIVHLMNPETRAFYQLERLWGGTPTEHPTPQEQAIR